MAVTKRVNQKAWQKAWKGTWERPIYLDEKSLDPFTLARMTDHNVRGVSDDKISSRTTSKIKALSNSALFSEELGIDLKSGKNSEIFKWFLASVLFGARISQTIAKNTYRAFARHHLLTPRRILIAGWDFLVNPIMREGGYVRYDGRKSTQILRNCEKLLNEYGGSFLRLHDAAADPRDLEARIMDFYGVGPVTTNIFLRELRPYWEKADPATLAEVSAQARKSKVPLSRFSRKSIEFTRIEAGLIRAA